MRRALTHATHAGVALLVALGLAACGGGGGGGSTSPVATSTSGVQEGTTAAIVPEDPSANVAVVRVDAGLDGRQINSAYVNVTVCAPGSSACQTIDHVLVDTGSSGLRLAASALNMALPAVRAPDGAPLAECASFVSGYSWGTVRSADVKIAGKAASGLPIQVVNDAAAAAPQECGNKGIDMGVPAGSNGILGVGMQASDCGAFCETSAASNQYFSCAASGQCTPSIAPRASQVSNPVASFASDNNGVALRLPAVPLGGSGAIEGQLIFGVGTRANNQLHGATIVRAEAPTGLMWTLYKGMSYPSFIDSGANGVFVADNSIPTCASGWFCPAEPTILSASMIEPAQDPRSVAMQFTFESEAQIGPAASAGNIARSSADRVGWYFVWGLPFYFGKTVFTSINGAATPVGKGPFWAF